MKRFFSLIILVLFCVTAISAQDTVKRYWSNKKLMSVGLEQNGLETGHWVYYHKNGVKWMEGRFEKGQKVGIWTEWYNDGKRSREFEAVLLKHGPVAVQLYHLWLV